MKMMKEGQSIFLQVFGGSPKMKILDFLLTHSSFDYSLTEIAQKTSVSYPIVVNVINDFLGNGIIIETRKIGKSMLFKLNTNSEFVMQLLKFQWDMAKKPFILASSTEHPKSVNNDNKVEVTA